MSCSASLRVRVGRRKYELPGDLLGSLGSSSTTESPVDAPSPWRIQKERCSQLIRVTISADHRERVCQGQATLRNSQASSGRISIGVRRLANLSGSDSDRCSELNRVRGTASIRPYRACRPRMTDEGKFRPRRRLSPGNYVALEITYSYLPAQVPVGSFLAVCASSHHSRGRGHNASRLGQSISPS